MHSPTEAVAVGTELYNNGQYEDAEQTLRDCLEKVRLDQSMRYLITNNLGASLFAQKKYTAAKQLFSDTLRARPDVKHPYTLVARRNLAWTCTHLGELEYAGAIMRETLHILANHTTHMDPAILDLKDNFSRLLCHQHKFSEARNVLQEVLEERQIMLGPDHPDTLSTAFQLVKCRKKCDSTEPQLHVGGSMDGAESKSKRSQVLLPAELWNQVIQDLNAFDKLSVHKAGLPLYREHVQHARAWARVFRRSEWLNAAVQLNGHPVLIGAGVKDLYEGSDTEKPIYLVLLSLCWHGNLQYEKPRILECLQDHEYNQDHHEAHILGTNITVNVCDGIGGSCRANAGVRDFTAIFDSSWSSFDQGQTTAVLYYFGSAIPELQTLHDEQHKSGTVRWSMIVGFNRNIRPGGRANWYIAKQDKRHHGYIWKGRKRHVSEPFRKKDLEKRFVAHRDFQPNVMDPKSFIEYRVR